MEQRYSTFSLLLINVTRCVQKIKNAEMAALGLKGTQVQCLFGLYNSPDGANLKQLCEICGEDKGMLSRTVKELTAQGLVYTDTAGGRRYKNPILLTEKGARIAGIVAEKISAFLEKGSAGLSDGERTQLYRSLSLISENLTEICKNYAPTAGREQA